MVYHRKRWCQGRDPAPRAPGAVEFTKPCWTSSLQSWRWVPLIYAVFCVNMKIPNSLNMIDSCSCVIWTTVAVWTHLISKCHINWYASPNCIIIFNYYSADMSHFTYRTNCDILTDNEVIWLIHCITELEGGTSGEKSIKHFCVRTEQEQNSVLKILKSVEYLLKQDSGRNSVRFKEKQMLSCSFQSRSHRHKVFTRIITRTPRGVEPAGGCIKLCAYFWAWSHFSVDFFVTEEF